MEMNAVVHVQGQGPEKGSGLCHEDAVVLPTDVLTPIAQQPLLGRRRHSISVMGKGLSSSLHPAQDVLVHTSCTEKKNRFQQTMCLKWDMIG